MTMRWRNVGLIFRREVLDQLRDRRTLFMIALLILSGCADENSSVVDSAKPRINSEDRTVQSQVVEAAVQEAAQRDLHIKPLHTTLQHWERAWIFSADNIKSLKIYTVVEQDHQELGICDEIALWSSEDSNAAGVLTSNLVFGEAFTHPDQFTAYVNAQISRDNLVHDGEVGTRYFAAVNAPHDLLARTSSISESKLKPGKHLIGVHALLTESQADQVRGATSISELLEAIPIDAMTVKTWLEWESHDKGLDDQANPVSNSSNR
ncbi:hypothetical protein GC163_14990 [bacterium]|nr:hypothetical protein [bacterium]